MRLKFIKSEIESQRKFNSNYIKHNAIRLCKQAIKSRELDKVQRYGVKKLL